jgi:DNA-binding CsgD family transcriptional regulator
MLHNPDVRAMIRLLGELSGSDADLAMKRPALLARLCEMIDGDAWAWSLDRRGTQARKGLCLASLAGTRGDVAAAHVATRDDAKAAGRKLTVRQICDDVVSSIHLTRRAGRPRFSAQEIKMAQIILSEIPWLHEKDPDAETARAGKGLSPREQATLVHWVNGLSSREIAERLGISPYTVQEYVKRIYQHYRVHGRPELLQRIALGWEKQVRNL